MAVLTTSEKDKLNRMNYAARKAVLGDRLANLDTDGTYLGDLGSTGNLTTADSWLVNSDSALPKVKLSAPDSGTGDYTLTVAAPTTMTANRTVILPAPGAGTLYFAVTTNADGSGAITNPTGTTEATFTVNSGASQLILSSSGLAGNRTFTFPDATGVVVTADASQTLTGKTLTAPTITAPTITGATSVTGGTFTSSALVAPSISGAVAITTPTVTGTWTNLGTVATVNIDGGTADGVVIGGATPAAATVTTLAINTSATFAAGGDLSCAGGDSFVDLSLGTGIFKTTTGTNTLGGNTIVADGKYLKVGSAAGGVANAVQLYSATAANGSFILNQPDNAGNRATTLQPISSMGQATTITLPDPGGATGTVMLLEGAQTVAAVKTFTAAPVVAVDDAANNAVTDLLTIKHTTSGDPSAGMGAGISVLVENDTDATTEAASVDFVMTNDGTKAALDVDVVVKTMLGGEVQPAMSVDASDQSVTIGQNVTDADGVNQLRIFPLTTAKGSLLVTAVANTGDTVTQITNEAFGQGTVLTIPDPGAATANFAYGDGDGKIAVANLAAATAALVAGTSTVTAGAEGAHKRTFTVQVKDAAGTNGTRNMVRVWISGTEYAAPSATDNTVDNVTGGAILRTVTANADYDFVTDAAGAFTFDLAVSGTTARFVMIEVNGQVKSSGSIAYD